MDTQKQIEFANSLLEQGLVYWARVEAEKKLYMKNVLDYGSRTDLPQTPKAAYTAIRERWESGEISASDIIDALKISRGRVNEVVLSRLLGIG